MAALGPSSLDTRGWSTGPIRLQLGIGKYIIYFAYLSINVKGMSREGYWEFSGPNKQRPTPLTGLRQTWPRCCVRDDVCVASYTNVTDAFLSHYLPLWHKDQAVSHHIRSPLSVFVQSCAGRIRAPGRSASPNFWGCLVFHLHEQP